MRVGGYTRVSSEEQANSGLGLAAQREAIQAEAERRGWELVWLKEDAGASGKSLGGRPGLAEALASLREGEAQALIVSKLDRLTRSVKDFAGLLELATKQKWALLALDVAIDTSTPIGEAMSFIVGTFSQLERRLIGERTKVALAQARARGTRLGAPVAVTTDIEARIVKRRKQGATLQQIADELNRDRIATPRKGRVWRHATIRAILGRHSVPTYPRGRRPGKSSSK